MPRQIRYIFVLKKFSRLLNKDFRRATKTNLVEAISDLEKQDTAYETKSQRRNASRDSTSG